MEAPTGVGLGGSPSPVGVGSWEGAVPPPQKKNCIFSFEMVHFDAFWRTFRYYDVQFMTSAEV